MNTVQVLNYKNQSIRQTVSKDGEILFCAKDVAQALEYKDARDIVRVLDDDEPHLLRCTDSSGRGQEMIFVDECQLYAILLSLRTERTKPFRKWVTHEVLPSIRKTGSYSLKPILIPYRNKDITPEKASKLLQDKDKKIKELMPFKTKDEIIKEKAAERRKRYRYPVKFLNIDTGKKTTIWTLPADVVAYLNEDLHRASKLYYRFKHFHNLEEFMRFFMKQDKFKF